MVLPTRPPPPTRPTYIDMTVGAVLAREITLDVLPIDSSFLNFFRGATA